MRILKYIFLLIFLLFIGLSVYVFTQNANCKIVNSIVIKSPKATIYNYINDYNNWETFYSLISNKEKIEINYSKKTSGMGSFCTWETDDSSGIIKTIYTKENDSIFQKMISNSEESTLSWKFKDTIGGTKVILNSKVKLDFKSKFLAFFNGGINKTVKYSYVKSLENLNKTLVYEINSHSIKINGIVERNGGFYLKQSIACREKNITKNLKILIPRMKKFFEKNNIVMHGKPFIVYNKYDKMNDIINLSVCISVKDSLHFTEGSDIEWVDMRPYTALKTTLVGDYSHTQKAWDSANNYLIKNKLVRNTSQSIIEVYVKGIGEVKQPSRWITEIYIPVIPRVVPKKQIYKKPIISSTTTDAIVPSTIPDETRNP